MSFFCVTHFANFEFVRFHLPGSGLQDIRKIIPFSGKGFVLGGSSQSSTSSPSSQKQAAHVANAPSSELVFASSSPRTLASPAPSGLDDRRKRISAAGQTPPVKKSVGNSKAFVNINGSPVKIPKLQSVASNTDGKKAQQKSIEDLFGFRKPPTKGSAVGGCDSSAPDRFSSVAFKGSHGGPAGATESKYFNHSSNHSSSSRKRTWDVHNDSASIFDFFQKAMSSDPSPKVKPPAGQQTAAAATYTATTSSGPSSSTASSSSSAALSVSCPVCQATVQESKINEHLDSCLS